MAAEERIKHWIKELHLEQHLEGGWFSEVYTAGAEYGLSKDGRNLGGSIYFLLAKDEISHLHVIDCDEIWYHHEGCGVRLWILDGTGGIRSELLGCGEGMKPMVVIPKGVIFGAENVDPASYTLMSCATLPKFHYEGFRLVPRRELDQQYPGEKDFFTRMTIE